MTNQEAINTLCNLRKIMISADEEDICYVGFGEDDIEAIEMAVAALVGRPITIEIKEIHQFAKPDDVSDLDFPNSETEVWNGPTGQTIHPKGTFEKIFNDPDGEE